MRAATAPFYCASLTIDADPRRTEPHRNEAPWPGIRKHRRNRASVNLHLQRLSFGRWRTRPWRAGANQFPERQSKTKAARAAAIWTRSRHIGLVARAAAPSSEG